jgi:DNA-binding protein H-NS
MKQIELEFLSAGELWDFHEILVAALVARIIAEKNVLEDRLSKLNRRPQVDQVSKIPKLGRTVLPKYRNPNQPSETWTGRGKQPRWLAAELKSGKQLDDFLI